MAKLGPRPEVAANSTVDDDAELLALLRDAEAQSLPQPVALTAGALSEALMPFPAMTPDEVQAHTTLAGPMSSFDPKLQFTFPAPETSPPFLPAPPPTNTPVNSLRSIVEATDPLANVINPEVHTPKTPETEIPVPHILFTQLETNVKHDMRKLDLGVVTIVASKKNQVGKTAVFDGFEFALTGGHPVGPHPSDLVELLPPGSVALVAKATGHIQGVPGSVEVGTRMLTDGNKPEQPEWTSTVDGWPKTRAKVREHFPFSNLREITFYGDKRLRELLFARFGSADTAKEIPVPIGLNESQLALWKTAQLEAIEPEAGQGKAKKKTKSKTKKIAEAVPAAGMLGGASVDQLGLTLAPSAAPTEAKAVSPIDVLTAMAKYLGELKRNLAAEARLFKKKRDEEQEKVSHETGSEELVELEDKLARAKAWEQQGASRQRLASLEAKRSTLAERAQALANEDSSWQPERAKLVATIEANIAWANAIQAEYQQLANEYQQKVANHSALRQQKYAEWQKRYAEFEAAKQAERQQWQQQVISKQQAAQEAQRVQAEQLRAQLRLQQEADLKLRLETIERQKKAVEIEANLNVFIRMAELTLQNLACGLCTKPILPTDVGTIELRKVSAQRKLQDVKQDARVVLPAARLPVTYFTPDALLVQSGTAAPSGNFDPRMSVAAQPPSGFTFSESQTASPPEAFVEPPAPVADPKIQAWSLGMQQRQAINQQATQRIQDVDAHFQRQTQIIAVEMQSVQAEIQGLTTALSQTQAPAESVMALTDKLAAAIKRNQSRAQLQSYEKDMKIALLASAEAKKLETLALQEVQKLLDTIKQKAEDEINKYMLNGLAVAVDLEDGGCVIRTKTTDGRWHPPKLLSQMEEFALTRAMALAFSDPPRYLVFDQDARLSEERFEEIVRRLLAEAQAGIIQQALISWLDPAHAKVLASEIDPTGQLIKVIEV